MWRSSWWQILLGFIVALMLHGFLPSHTPVDAFMQEVAQWEDIANQPSYYAPKPDEPLLKQAPALGQLMVAKALILTTYDTEGTYPHEASYNITYGYERFEGYDDHPRKLVCRVVEGRELCSDAAGACQFISPTFDGIYNAYSQYFLTHHPRTGEPIGKFHPLNQDRACLLNYIDKGGYPEVMKDGNWGITDDGLVWVDEAAIDRTFQKLCAQWASFQCLPGEGFGDSNGYYDRPEYGNQNAVPIEETRRMFLTYLEQQMAIVRPPAVAQTPPRAPPVDANNPEASFPEEWMTPGVDGEAIPTAAGGTVWVTDIRRIRTEDVMTGEPTNYWHKGWDVGGDTGIPLYAPLPGKAVCYPDPYPGQKVGPGNSIEFFPDAMPDVKFVHKHLTDCADLVWDGSSGEPPIFGHLGSTGYSTGPHLHSEKWVGSDHVDFGKGWIYAFFMGKLPTKGG